MKKVMTKDNSETFFSERFQETYHSTSGAIEEAFKKFVEPCKIQKLAENNQIIILDICFGLGYNSAAAVEKIKKINPDCKIEIIGLENDEQIFDEIQKLSPKLKYFYLIKKLKQNNYKIAEQNIKIKILIGDARDAVKKINKKFDAVFLDPFSPKKCPDLWTYDFFKHIKKLIKPGAVMATYSCAGSVRKNLKKAGFNTKDGPIVGRKSPGTIAYLKPL